jgi:acyl carrier protein
VSPEIPHFSSIFHELVRHFDNGDFRPLPYRVFPIAEITDAFKYMAQAKHIGKIILSFQGKDAVKTRLTSRSEAGVSLRSIVGWSEEPSESAEMLFPEVGEASSADRVKSIKKAAVSRLGHQRPELSTEYVAPRNETEKTLAEIWQTLIGVDQVGIYDNFFELGGDSLLAAQVNSRLYKAFQVKLSLSAILEEPTVASLAERIEKIRQSAKKLQTLPDTQLTEEEEEGEI